MYDAKRIARLIGTLNIKGQESTSERPWRRSRLLISPDDAGSDEELARRAEHAAHNTDFLRKIIAANPESAGAAGGRTEAAKALRAMGYGTQRQRASPGSGPPTDGPLTTEPHMTDMGNAQRLALYAAGDLLYVDHRKKWVTWDGCRWRIDITSAVQAMAKQCVRQMYAEAGQRFSAIATQLKTASVEGETL
jgi:hypothetical protein